MPRLAGPAPQGKAHPQGAHLRSWGHLTARLIHVRIRMPICTSLHDQPSIPPHLFCPTYHKRTPPPSPRSRGRQRRPSTPDRDAHHRIASHPHRLSSCRAVTPRCPIRSSRAAPIPQSFPPLRRIDQEPVKATQALFSSEETIAGARLALTHTYTRLLHVGEPESC